MEIFCVFGKEVVMIWAVKMDQLGTYFIITITMIIIHASFINILVYFMFNCQFDLLKPQKTFIPTAYLK